MPTTLDSLRAQWTTLHRTTLPSLAASHDPAQPSWPVSLDHCFARIILDNAVGVTKPWSEALASPASKHMSERQLRAAIALGEEIQTGEADLVALDARSLELRGKSKGLKRKRDEQEVKMDENETQQLPTPEASPQRVDEENKLDHDALVRKIQRHPQLSPFRRATLALLTQVPRGRYTTYQALADGIARTRPSLMDGKKGSARAVGSAMRNNPFAPEVPCHRCLASDGKIGGFKGVWNAESENGKLKRRMLREEGIRFDGGGKVVGAPFSDFR